MKFLEFLKQYEQFDKYVLFLLSLGFSVDEVSKLTEISRQTVYNILERNGDIVEQYMTSVEEVIDERNSDI